MSWLKSLRGRGGDDDAPGRELDVSMMGGDEPEPHWFRPRTDGTYVAGEDAQHCRYLRFYTAGKVYLGAGPAGIADVRPLLGPGNPDPTVGQYTGAGRFTVQRRFDRPIVCTVLDLDADGFSARVTTTDIPRTVGVYRYAFQPDDAAG